MKVIKAGVNRRFGKDVPSEIQFFQTALIGTFFASFNTLILSLISSQSYHGTILSAACCLFISIISITSSLDIFKKYQDAAILLFCISINIIFFPAMYLTCGGIDGGMPIYFVLGIVFTILLLEGLVLIISLILEAIVYIAVFSISYYNLELTNLFAVLGDRTYIDIALSSVVVGWILGYVLRRLSNSYETERKRSNELYKKLENLSTRDALTGVFNRRFLMAYLEALVEKVKFNEIKGFSIIMFDIDHFKHINDTYGHIVGDEVLKNLTEIFTKNLRNYDITARYGGEEFIVVINTQYKEIVLRRAEQIRATVEQAVLSSSINEPITISGGIAAFDKNLTVEQLISIADKNLYTAKETGRNKIVESTDDEN